MMLEMFFAKSELFADVPNVVAKIQELVLERNQDTLIGSNCFRKTQQELIKWS